MATTHRTIHPVEVGDDITINVVPSQTRTTYLPDQAAVFGRGPDSVEIVLLRQEIALRAQIGKVTGDDGHLLRMEFRPGEVDAEMVDIAHLRLSATAATDMAFGILSLSASAGVSVEELVNRLRSACVGST